MPKFRDLAGKTFGRLTVRKYENYGGRGITICDEWKDNFAAFYEYVSKLEHFGEPGYSLDRIDNGIPRIYAWGVCQSTRALADKYGLHISTIRRIINEEA